MRSRHFQNILMAWLACGFGASAATNSIPADAFVIRRFEWIPPYRQFRLVPVKFPDTKPTVSVEALATSGDRVWIAAGRGTTPTCLPERENCGPSSRRTTGSTR